MNLRKTILLVDDSENDIDLMRMAFRKAEVNSPLQEVHNGEEAITYLKGEGIYSDREKYPLPSVMLLDLNMPMKNGFDVLSWVRTQPALKL
jgi:CheY-like chemotaxis protein